jgi:hypothetical protein
VPKIDFKSLEISLQQAIQTPNLLPKPQANPSTINKPDMTATNHIGKTKT